MVSNPSPRDTPAATPPRYRGFRGALAYGLRILSLFTVLALLGGAVMFGITGNFLVVQFISTRLFLLGFVAAGAAALARWVCGGASDRVMTRKLVAGDLAGAAGLLVGLLVPGGVAEHNARRAGADQGLPVEGHPVQIAGPTLDGRHYDLSEHRGKAVLVDFWASWCGPCIAELPHVREAYEKYHDQGLDVVSVSLDFKRESLVRFLEANPAPWPQIFFGDEDKLGWDNPLARRYGITGIPFLMVVGRDGNVAAIGVRGPLIKSAVADALGVGSSGTGRVGEVVARLVNWAMYTVMRSSTWMFVLCGWGAAVVLGLVEFCLRRGFHRAAAPAS